MTMQSTKQAIQERACPVCGSRSYAHFSDERINPKKIDEFSYASRKEPEFMCLRLVRCLTCDLVYAPTPPTTDYLSTAYQAASFDSAPEAQAAAATYAKALTPYVAKLGGRHAAVDVGAGSGPLLPWLRKNGFDPVVGIEPSRAAIDAAPPAVKAMLREGMFSPAMLADTRPSLVCSFMTLEHIADPAEFVGQVYDLLEPGGMLAVVVHNWRAPLNRALGLRSPIIDIEHLQLFSPQAMRTMLSRAGYVSVDLRSISNTYPLRYWLRLTPLPGIIKGFVSGIIGRAGLSGLPIPMRVGNMLAVGIKPLA